MSDSPHNHGDEREAPNADQFEERHESHVPWDDDEPIVREDEQYERLGERNDDSLIPDPYTRGIGRPD